MAAGFAVILSLNSISSPEREGMCVFPQVGQQANAAFKTCSYSIDKKLSKWS